MEILLDREVRSKKSTIGKLYVDGKFQCFILEDQDRGLKSTMPVDEIMAIKVKHQTCIPEGRYQVKRTFSNRFQKILPSLLNVPGFDGIRIHPGNTDADSSGCLLPGQGRSVDMVSNSRKAFQELDNLIAAAEQYGEKIYITVQA